MNKTAIKNFSINARRKLIADVSFQAGLLGITDKGIASPLKQSTSDLQFFDIGTKEYAQVSGSRIRQRNMLAAAIRAKAQEVSYEKAFRLIMEEIAYTWFNRLIAIRFMEVNDYLPDHVRVLSSENPAKLEPDLVTRPFDTGLQFTPQERDTILQMKDENHLDELFRMLFIKECDALRQLLPGLFEHTREYAELLLSISFTDTDGVVYKLTHEIEEKDFNVAEEGQVEIIGWLYQYYNTEPKSEAFAKGTVTKDEIPAVTQLFTPDWIVRYMVENSLGRLWLDGHPDAAALLLPTKEEQDAYVAGNRSKDDTKWHYYLEEAEQEESVRLQLEQIRAEHAKLNPEDIRLIDPCMGSGHILVYAFDAFMQIYLSQGYTPRDAARCILQCNLYGADIDPRAYQLAYFAVMMKARQYNRRILTEGITPNVIAIRNPSKISQGALKRLGDLENLGKRLLDTFAEAEEFGSILNVEFTDRELNSLDAKLDDLSRQALFANLLDAAEMNECVFVMEPLLKQARILGQKYHVTVTNPPYMAPTVKQKTFVEKFYPASKADLFAVFMEKCREMLAVNGYQAMINMHGWMFLSSYEKLRALVCEKTLSNLLHLGPKAFDEIEGEVVQTVAFVLQNSIIHLYRSTYCRLVRALSQSKKELMFLSCHNRYCVDSSRYSHTPKRRFIYWIGNGTLWERNQISSIFRSGGRNKTHNNDRYVRAFWEVIPSSRWVLYMNGGNYRKWYGNLLDVVDWSDMARKEYASHGGLVDDKNVQALGISWNGICGDLYGFRLKPRTIPFSSSSPTIVWDKNVPPYAVLGLLNSSVGHSILSALNPTLQLNVGEVLDAPLELPEEPFEIEQLSEKCIHLAKTDWDSFETSYDYKTHPLIQYRDRWTHEAIDYSDAKIPEEGWICDPRIDSAFDLWQMVAEKRFNDLKANEEELNKIFIEIYGLQDELTPEVEDKDVTVRKADLKRDIRSFVSYAVGCMFGRYSLDEEGLIYAGGEWDDSKYTSFIPDADNCIPIIDAPYFEDDAVHRDAVSRFVEFVRTVYGEETLEENLQFIADALGNKGDTSREVIRNYFLNDFYKDHLKVYQKRPIYWLFDSGKQNGFKALVYMHRWNADTIGNVRAEYLERMQKKLDSEMERMDAIIEGSSSARDVSKAEKQKEKLRKQAKECAEYAQKLSHLANYRIDIDLDDGVKVNYRKVQTDPSGKLFEILANSKDIMAKEK